jgi:hypothetical protein
MSHPGFFYDDNEDNLWWRAPTEGEILDFENLKNADNPINFSHTQERCTWVDYTPNRLRQKSQNLIGIIWEYNEFAAKKANYGQKFVLMQPGKKSPVKITVLIFSNTEEEKPRPVRTGQIAYFRNAFMINSCEDDPVFIINTNFPQWRCLILFSEKKAEEKNCYVNKHGNLFTDFESGECVIGNIS